jgi:polyvinyl alcohol dehydrogenase (cytochrome)
MVVAHRRVAATPIRAPGRLNRGMSDRTGLVTPSRRRLVTVTAIALGSLVVLAGCTSSTLSQPSPVATPPTRSSGPAWSGYHNDNARTGASPEENEFDHLATAWTTRLPGALHNQPVAADGRIIAADESNHVSALDPRTGKVLWRRYLGTPLANVVQLAGCGNIDPLGITSTPVIDTATNTVYVVGEIHSSGTRVHHELEGIDIRTGRVVLTENVDPPLPHGQTAIHLLQRASLALAKGRVYISYGGNSGDCGNYHGWVVGVNETGSPHAVSFEVASDGEGGAIWQSGGAPAIDTQGNLYVTTGNANPDPPQGGPDPKKYTESVVKLSPTLHPLASFKDTIAGGDEDLSTGNPVLLPNGYLFAVGKTDVGYLLRQGDLSKVASVTGVCGSDPDGGPAFDATLNRLFVPCRGGGIQQVNLSSAGKRLTLGPRLATANSAPILVGQRLWALQYPDGVLSEFNAKTDAALQSVRVGATVAHFASPSSAFGLLLVGTDDGITALTGATGNG